MQAVILAAGRGSRMGALTKSVPKPLLEVAGKTLLEHKFEILPEDVGEIILVVSYLDHVIRERIGGEYRGKQIRYVEQNSPTGGTADALWCAKQFLSGKFVVMNGDNLYAAKDLAVCRQYEWAVLVKEMENVRTGRVVADEGGCITGIAENTVHDGEHGYANTGLYVMDTRIFNYSPVPKAPGSKELGLPQTMMQATKDICIKAIPATFWVEIKNEEDLKTAERTLGDIKKLS